MPEPNSPVPQPGSHRLSARTGVRLSLIALSGLALLPSVLPWTEERSEQDAVCVAILDGWKRARPLPSEADVQELWNALTAPLPTREEMNDPVKRQAWVDAERRRQAQPGYKRAAAYSEWLDGPGACVPEAHDRMRLSLIGFAVVVTAALVVRARGRPPEGEGEATAEPG
jgi:hypothetical protein